ncbi:MAG TPA: helix-hairpin-helix domain-containing protein [Verrucomicrobiota bacterium]|nr:helix-hairpin-helix domain-containing protein [Verrucomicrobiota bacterium]
MRAIQAGRSGPAGRGFVLLLVLVVVMLASMVAVSLMFLLGAEKTASATGWEGEQAWAVALTGLERAMQVARRSEREEAIWRDNPAEFRDQLVQEDGLQRWLFTVYSPGDDESGWVRFGLTDEASKLNILRSSSAMLEALSDMRLEGGGGWSGVSSAPVAGEEGAGAGSQSGTATNGLAGGDLPWSCADEYLQSSGASWLAWCGEDANFNGRLDANENDGETQWPPDNQDSRLDRGLRQDLTVHSYDVNQDGSGQPRIRLNDPQADWASAGLPASVGDYVAAMRRSGQSIEHPAALLEAEGTFPAARGAGQETVRSGVGKDELPALLDRCTGSDQERLEGLINVNTAPAAVLRTLPGIDEAMAEAIVARRSNLSQEDRRTIAWLYQEGLMNADQFKQVAPLLTTRSLQFHCYVAGFNQPGRRHRILEAIFDVASETPRVLFLRDVTRSGLPPTLVGEESETMAWSSGGGGSR